MSDFEKPVTEMVSSSSEPSSSAFSMKMTSEELGRDCSRLSESPNDDSVSDADSVGIELSKLNTLDSEELDLCLESCRTMGSEW